MGDETCEHADAYWIKDSDYICNDCGTRFTALLAIHVYEDDLYEIETLGEVTDFGFLPLPEDENDEEC